MSMMIKTDADVPSRSPIYFKIFKDRKMRYQTDAGVLSRAPGQRQFLIRVNDRPALLDCALLTKKQLLQEQQLHRQLQQEERQHDRPALLDCALLTEKQHDHPALLDCSLGDNDEE